MFLLHPTSSHVPSVFIFTQSLRGQHYFDDGDGDDDGKNDDDDDVGVGDTQSDSIQCLNVAKK